MSCCSSKKHSWIFFVICAIVFAGVVYTVARLFIHYVNKDQIRLNRRRKQEAGEELFI